MNLVYLEPEEKANQLQIGGIVVLTPDNPQLYMIAEISEEMYDLISLSTGKSYDDDRCLDYLTKVSLSQLVEEPHYYLGPCVIKAQKVDSHFSATKE